jgi:hypothetical protein
MGHLMMMQACTTCSHPAVRSDWPIVSGAATASIGSNYVRNGDCTIRFPEFAEPSRCILDGPVWIISTCTAGDTPIPFFFGQVCRKRRDDACAIASLGNGRIQSFAECMNLARYPDVYSKIAHCPACGSLLLRCASAKAAMQVVKISKTAARFFESNTSARGLAPLSVTASAAAVSLKLLPDLLLRGSDTELPGSLHADRAKRPIPLPTCYKRTLRRMRRWAR